MAHGVVCGKNAMALAEMDGIDGYFIVNYDRKKNNEKMVVLNKWQAVNAAHAILKHYGATE